MKGQTPPAPTRGGVCSDTESLVSTIGDKNLKVHKEGLDEAASSSVTNSKLSVGDLPIAPKSQLGDSDKTLVSSDLPSLYHESNSKSALLLATWQTAWNRFDCLNTVDFWPQLNICHKMLFHDASIAMWGPLGIIFSGIAWWGLHTHPPLKGPLQHTHSYSFVALWRPYDNSTDTFPLM